MSGVLFLGQSRTGGRKSAPEEEVTEQPVKKKAASKSTARKPVKKKAGGKKK